MKILAIDPGPKQSGYVVLHRDGSVPEKGVVENAVLEETCHVTPWDGRLLAVERPAAMGMAVADEVFESAFWAGVFVGAWGGEYRAVKRIPIKVHHCGSARAKDSNVRHALIDRYGGHDKAIGGKRCPACNGKGWRGRGRRTCEACGGSKWLHPPGPLHGIAGDCWAALALACYVMDTTPKPKAVA